jgi:phage/plasmid-associated DNA primase
LPPSAVKAAASYRQDSDHVLSFIKEECQPSERGVKPSALFDVYKRYAADNRFGTLSSNTFGKRLAAAGIKKRKSDGSEYWLLEPMHAPKKSIPLEEYID